MIQDLWTDMECIDLSVPLSEEYPLNWPSLPPFRKRLLNWFKEYTEPNGVQVPSRGLWYTQSFEIDEHTGTHVDFPSHSFPFDELKALGLAEEPPLKSFAGPAVVIDARACLDQAPAGISPRIPVEVAETWEKKHGPIQSGEVVLLNSGYFDRYFAPFPEGKHLLQDFLDRSDRPGWPVPSDDLLQFLAKRGTCHLGISSPSLGALDNNPGPHQLGVKLGMTFAECLINLHKLPPRGALYVGLPLKIAKQSGSPVRAVAFVPRNLGKEDPSR